MYYYQNLTVNESRYISLIVFSGSIKNLFSIDCVNIYLFQILFLKDFVQWRKLFSVDCVNNYIF